MTTRKKLQEWLNRFPEDTIIELAIQNKPIGYENWGEVEFVSPTLTNSDDGDGWKYTDFSKNKFVTPDKHHYGKRILTLGEST